MPTRLGGRRRTGERAGCRTDILAAVREAGRPLTRRQALRERGTGHGPGTVAKALAELTAAGELVNSRDRRGYRLPDWPRPTCTPSRAPAGGSWAISAGGWSRSGRTGRVGHRW